MNKKVIMSIILAVTLSATLVGCGQTPITQGTQTNAPKSTTVLAKFGDISITQQDLNNYIEAYKQGMLEAIVQDKVIAKIAKDNGVEITEEQVNTEVENYKASIGSEEDFEKLLVDNKTTLAGFKLNIEQMLVREELLTKLKDDIIVTDEDIASYYNGKPDELKLVDVVEYSLPNKGDIDKLMAEISKGSTSEQVKEVLGEIVNVRTIENIGSKHGETGENLLKLKLGETYTEESISEDQTVYQIIKVRNNLEDLKESIEAEIRESGKYGELDRLTQLELENKTIEYVK